MVRRALLQLGCASGLMLLTVTNCPFHSKLEIEVKMEELELRVQSFSPQNCEMKNYNHNSSVDFICKPSLLPDYQATHLYLCKVAYILVLFSFVFRCICISTLLLEGQCNIKACQQYSELE